MDKQQLWGDKSCLQKCRWLDVTTHSQADNKTIERYLYLTCRLKTISLWYCKLRTLWKIQMLGFKDTRAAWSLISKVVERPHSSSHSRQIYMFRFRSFETPETCQETSPEQTTSNQSYTAKILELSFSILQLIMFLEL
jgi:hypothetical protein